MSKHQISNNFINAQHQENNQFLQIHTTLELHIPNALNPLLIKETVLPHIQLPLLEPSLIDSAWPTKRVILNYPLKLLLPVTKQSITIAREDSLAELWTMLKYMDSLKKVVLLTILLKITSLTATLRSRTVSNTRLTTIV